MPRKVPTKCRRCDKPLAEKVGEVYASGFVRGVGYVQFIVHGVRYLECPDRLCLTFHWTPDGEAHYERRLAELSEHRRRLAYESRQPEPVPLAVLADDGRPNHGDERDHG